MTEEQEVLVDPSNTDWTSTTIHAREAIWRKGALHQQKLVKEEENFIQEQDKKFAVMTGIFYRTKRELEHHQDMLYHLLHRPYMPKPRGNKRSTKNKGKIHRW